jgi:4a-hydroxytetrahydrobiopterin dehydratase
MSMCFERVVRADRSLHPPGSGAAPQPPRRLDPAELEAALDEIHPWEQTLDGSRIYRAFLFPTPAMAPAFATFAYAVAQECGHYPSVQMRSSTVVCYLSTMEADGVTEKDLELARRLSIL